MVPHSQSFYLFGTAFSIVLFLIITIPILRRRREAVTAWHLFLLGTLFYIGLGSLEVAGHRLSWKELRWFQPNSHERSWFFMGAIVFAGSLLFFHRYVKFPSRMIQNRLAKWPELSSGLLFFVLVSCLVISLSPVLLAHIPFLGEVAQNFSYAALATATTFATVYWLKSRGSLFAFLIMLTVFAVAVIEAMIVFHGRRILISVSFGPIAACYWLWWRHWSTKRLVSIIAFAGAGVLVAAMAYSTFRHLRSGEDRSMSTMLAKLSSIRFEDITRPLTDFPKYVGQENIHYSMLVMRLVDTHKLEPKPLVSLHHVASYPIPRRVWPGKPRDLSTFIVRETLKMPYRTTWGLGIVGHGYYEGGMLTLIVYAFLVSLMIRFFDEPLQRQPDNPFLISALAIASPHLVAWTRGGASTMTVNCLEAFAFILFLGYICRMFFGTARNRYPHPTYGSYPAMQQTAYPHSQDLRE